MACCSIALGITLQLACSGLTSNTLSRSTALDVLGSQSSELLKPEVFELKMSWSVITTLANSPRSSDWNNKDAFQQMDALQAAGLVVNKRRTQTYSHALGPAEVWSWDLADPSCLQPRKGSDAVNLIVGLPEFTAVTGISQAPQTPQAIVEVDINVKLTDCYKRFNQAILSSKIPTGVWRTPLRSWKPNLSFPTRHHRYRFTRYDDGWRVDR